MLNTDDIGMQHHEENRATVTRETEQRKPIIETINVDMINHVHSSIAIILMEKRELVALLNLSFWSRGYKKFPCSTQLCTKFILLINVKIPTIVGILTFTYMINTTSERFKATNFFVCQYFSFYEQLKFRAQLS